MAASGPCVKFCDRHFIKENLEKNYTAVIALFLVSHPVVAIIL